MRHHSDYRVSHISRQCVRVVSRHLTRPFVAGSMIAERVWLRESRVGLYRDARGLLKPINLYNFGRTVAGKARARQRSRLNLAKISCCPEVESVEPIFSVPYIQRMHSRDFTREI